MSGPAAPVAAAPPTRLYRRKARTRRALLDAARVIVSERNTGDVSIQEITDRADVGFGSFYNHFATKADLFDAAVAEVLEEHGRLLDGASAGWRSLPGCSPSGCARPPASPRTTR